MEKTDKIETLKKFQELDQKRIKRVVKAAIFAFKTEEFIMDPITYSNQETWVCDEVKETAIQQKTKTSSKEERETLEILTDYPPKTLQACLQELGFWENLMVCSRECWNLYKN